MPDTLIPDLEPDIGPEAGYPAESYKVPPHSIEAEQSVLGGLMLDNDAWHQVSDRVREQDFYRHDHRLIFRAIEQLAEHNQPLDVVTLSEWLERNDLIDDAGGIAALSEMARGTPSAANIRAYADIVRERSVLRQLIGAGTRIANSGFDCEGRNSAELLDEAEQLVFGIAEQGNSLKSSYQPIKDVLVNVVERMDMLAEQDGNITGISTGFTDLDELTSGLQPGDLVIVAGRPSMGKTAFSMNLAENASVGAQQKVAVFSLEMPSEQLALRMMSSLGRIDSNRVRTGKLTDDDWPRLNSAMAMLAEASLFIDDTPSLSPTDLRARARRIKREHGLDLIIVDYLQLMQVPGNAENRTNEISIISRSLKALAKELSVPVIALSQLNRAVEQRDNKRPRMSDLRESGSIEQDADVIMFIYRDEVYNDNSQDKGTAEICVAKQRNGPIGTRRLAFLGEFTRFENFVYDPYGAGPAPIEDYE